ncbi:MAG: hypothetical protein ACK6A8_03190, partial [Planctomycetota bacterium]
MSAAFAPFEPHNDAIPPAIPAVGSEPAISTVPARAADRPIRFPHIPSIDQTPPGMSLYLQQRNQALRVDTPHATLNQTILNQTAGAASQTSIPSGNLGAGTISPTQPLNGVWSTVHSPAPAIPPA